jgi:drug/metabolite transporter (DMT)-like permease
MAQLLGILASLATAALFAGANVYHRRAARHVGGVDATVLTLTLNSAIFLPLGLAYWWGTGAPALDGVTVALASVVAFFALIVGRLGMYNTIMLIGAARASAVKNVAPLFTLGLALLVLGVAPPPVSVVGVLLIVAGVWLYGRESGGPAPGVDSPAAVLLRRWPLLGRLPMHTAGLLLGLAVAAAYAAADVLRVLLLEREHDVLTATVLVGVAGTVLITVPCAVRGDLTASLRRSTGGARRDLVKAGVLMGVGQLTNMLAVSLLFVGYVTALVATAPLFTAVLSRLLDRGGDRFGRGFWLATGLLVPGAVLISLGG